MTNKKEEIKDETVEITEETPISIEEDCEGFDEEVETDE